MTQPTYERIAHTADLAIRVWGRDLPALFANAAVALFDMMTEPPAVEDRERTVTVESMDVEALLVDWLNELIYLHEVEGETFTRFEITEFSEVSLTACVYGGPTTRKLKAVKAATFHDLTIRDTTEGVEARLVFDV
ncbi:MAG: archease [Armatimonadota bacterium]